MTDATQNKNRPQTLREGALKLAIFENESEQGKYRSGVLTRSYKDKEDQWQETASLRERDMLDASHLLSRGHDLIRKEKQRERQQQQAQSQGRDQSQDQDHDQGPQGPSY